MLGTRRLTKPMAACQTRQVTTNGAARSMARPKLPLTAREFALLAFLMANAGALVSRERLLSGVWRMGFDPGSNLVDVYVRYLRRKLGDGVVRTVHGVGYAGGTGGAG